MKQEMIEKISIAVMNLLNDYSEDLRKYAENNIAFVLNDIANIAGITCADIDELAELEGMYQIVTVGIAYYYCGLSAAYGTCRENLFYDRYQKLTSALSDQIQEVECWLVDEGSECCDCDCDDDCCEECGCDCNFFEDDEKEDYVELALGLVEAMKDERVFSKLRETIEYLSVADFV